MTIHQKIIDALSKYSIKLKDIILTYDSVVNNCTTNDPNLSLSAAQGKVLQDQITTLSNQMGGINVFSRCINAGESVTFDLPLSTRAIVVGNIAKSTDGYGLESHWLYLDSQPNLVYIGNMNKLINAPTNMSLTNDEESVTFYNGHASYSWNLVFVVFNGSVTERV